MSSRLTGPSLDFRFDSCCAICYLLDIVDIKPANMEELTEVVTAADFHPISCNILVYSSSRGSIKLGDMRESALCDNHAKRECLTLAAGSCA